MKIKILNKSATLLNEEIKQHFSAEKKKSNPEIQFTEEDPFTVSRGIDPTILVALVGAGSTVLGALITGLFQLMQKNGGKSITIETKNGSKLTYPADYPIEKLDAAKQLLQEMDAEPVKIVLK